MNNTKLFTDIIKAAEARDAKGKLSPFMYCDVTEGEYKGRYITEGRFLVRVPFDYCYVSEKCFTRTFDGAEKYTENIPDTPVYDSGMTRVLADGRKVRVLQGDTFESWIDENYLKYFKGCDTFHATDKKSPVYISNEYGIFCGLILPVNH